jgi:hemerythrin-like domain-containing protein
MSSFTAVLAVHERLTELFLLHQEALLQLDVPLARARLQHYERELYAHMKVEEELLMPIYHRAGQIPGGPSEFFLGEHRRMREFLARFTTRLQGLPIENASLPRAIIQLFDEEATFKALCEHHDMRERNLFFPALDRVTSEAERQTLLPQCFSETEGGNVRSGISPR